MVVANLVTFLSYVTLAVRVPFPSGQADKVAFALVPFERREL